MLKLLLFPMMLLYLSDAAAKKTFQGQAPFDLGERTSFGLTERALLTFVP